MEPKIINKDQFKIIGVRKRFKAERQNFDNIWNEFMKHHNKIKASSIDDGFYGINFPPDENDVQDYMTYKAKLPILRSSKSEFLSTTTLSRLLSDLNRCYAVSSKNK